MRAVIVVLGLLSVLLLQAGARAEVPPGYAAVAAEYGVPPALLYSVALTESGTAVQRADGRGTVRRPWPWSLNVDGRGERYASRAEACAALQRYLQAGRSVDIGLMQVNWRHHRELLREPCAAALDPWFNLRAGAWLLRRHFEATGDWWRAAGRYHTGSDGTEQRRTRALRYVWRVAGELPRAQAIEGVTP